MTLPANIECLRRHIPGRFCLLIGYYWEALATVEFLGLFVVSMSEPNTSVIVLRIYVCTLACLNRPLIFYIHAHCTFHEDWLSACNALSSPRDESKGLHSDCCIGVNDWEGRQLRLNAFASRMATYFQELKSVSQVWCGAQHVPGGCGQILHIGLSLCSSPRLSYWPNIK